MQSQKESHKNAVLSNTHDGVFLLYIKFLIEKQFLCLHPEISQQTLQGCFLYIFLWQLEYSKRKKPNISAMPNIYVSLQTRHKHMCYPTENHTKLGNKLGQHFLEVILFPIIHIT